MKIWLSMKINWKQAFHTWIERIDCQNMPAWYTIQEDCLFSCIQRMWTHHCWYQIVQKHGQIWANKGGPIEIWSKWKICFISCRICSRVIRPHKKLSHNCHQNASKQWFHCFRRVLHYSFEQIMCKLCANYVHRKKMSIWAQFFNMHKRKQKISEIRVRVWISDVY